PKIQSPIGGRAQGTKGLKWRWLEHACNKGNWSPVGKKAVNHLLEYRKNRNALNKAIDDWEKTRCKKKYQLPDEWEKYKDPGKEPVLGSKTDIDGNPIPCDELTF